MNLATGWKSLVALSLAPLSLLSEASPVGSPIVLGSSWQAVTRRRKVQMRAVMGGSSGVSQGPPSVAVGDGCPTV